MWIDTHCHLDAHEFGSESAAVAARAAQQGVNMIVIPAVERANFDTVAGLARSVPNACYALGIHPIHVPQAHETDLEILRDTAQAALADSRFVGIGEIGLDFFVPMLCEPAMREKQEHFFRAQLRIARDLDLPVLMHVRRSQDIILKHLRQVSVPGGIAHAFNGSSQQAQSFVKLGFKLGFGGAMTFSRALQIRRLAAELPLSSVVLETDAPDISPAWVHPARNSPEQLPAIGRVLADLRSEPEQAIAAATTANALAAMPRMRALLGTLL